MISAWFRHRSGHIHIFTETCTQKHIHTSYSNISTDFLECTDDADTDELNRSLSMLYIDFASIY